MSRPLWARELKHRNINATECVEESRPLWARELKLEEAKKDVDKRVVAPLVGA